MYSNLFADQFEHYINQFIKELNAFHKEDQIWETAGQISNSPGVLAKHIIGNLNHYLGFGLGYTDYHRDRMAEFSEERVHLADLIRGLEETRKLVADVLEKETDLTKPYPEELFKGAGTLGSFLARLSTHLAYHVGQVNYYRRGL